MPNLVKTFIDQVVEFDIPINERSNDWTLFGPIPSTLLVFPACLAKEVKVQSSDGVGLPYSDYSEGYC